MINMHFLNDKTFKVSLWNSDALIRHAMLMSSVLDEQNVLSTHLLQKEEQKSYLDSLRSVALLLAICHTYIVCLCKDSVHSLAENQEKEKGC